MYNVALQKCQRGYGVDSEEVAEVEYGYARHLMTRSDEEALQVAYKRAKNALPTRLSIFGQNHSKFVLSAQQVAQIEIQRGDLQSAEKSVRMADQGCSFAMDRNPTLLAQQLNLESNLPLAQGRFEEAEKLAQRFLDAQVQLFGAGHPLLATAQKALEVCRNKQKAGNRGAQ